MDFQKAEYEWSAGVSSGLPASTLPEIVFSGRSNVGKSSLINCIVNRKSLAHTSSTPGKTASINFYRLSFCRFADLPGYGYARVAKSARARWSELVEGYFAQDRKIRLVIQLVDMRRIPAEDDVQMMNFLTAKQIPYLVAATKCDKLNASEFAEQNARLAELCRAHGVDGIPFSALTGRGTEQIRSAILSACR